MADQSPPPPAPPVTPPPPVSESDHPLPPSAETHEPPPPPPPAAEESPATEVSESPAENQKEDPSPAPQKAEKEDQPPSVEVVVKEEPLPLPVPPPTSAPESGTREKLGEFLADDSEKPSSEPRTKIPQSLISFKEESNKVADLSEPERKALQELKQLIEQEQKTETEEVSIWGVPLFKDDRTDVILLKFLRARDFKVKDALVMFKNTIRWRKEFGIEELLDEDLGDDLEKVVFMHGTDKEGHPVCYNVFGEFQNKDLYQKTFSDQEKRTRFLRYRIQFLERSIRKLDFSPGCVCTIFQVNDLKNSPGPAKKELRIATKQALHLLQDNYPEFVAKQVFINVPWWHLAFYTMISPFLTQRTKSKFVFAGPVKSPETLFKYISPEQVPIQYGGLSVDFCDCNPEFSISDPVTEVNVKPGTKQTVEIIIYEKCVIVWELRVVGWEVSYGSEFVPNTEGGYTIIIHKSRKIAPSDEPVVQSSFKVDELGRILLTIDNPTSKKKRLLYRFKIKPLSD
ncbi:hypothetical protein TIFTF001_034645 [Ficus carica]|uniref:Patellin-3 n=1 Tax=Ficus carica TaxID=3494 RepID=A0AA88E439_FICCA|nr:hypothetical protein TIFTF001_034645 [Ficus carica]